MPTRPKPSAPAAAPARGAKGGAITDAKRSAAGAAGGNAGKTGQRAAASVRSAPTAVSRSATDKAPAKSTGKAAKTAAKAPVKSSGTSTAKAPAKAATKGTAAKAPAAKTAAGKASVAKRSATPPTTKSAKPAAGAATPATKRPAAKSPAPAKGRRAALDETQMRLAGGVAPDAALEDTPPEVLIADLPDSAVEALIGGDDPEFAAEFASEPLELEAGVTEDALDELDAAPPVVPHVPVRTVIRTEEPAPAREPREPTDEPPPELDASEWYRREKARRTKPLTNDLMAEARELLLQAVAEAGPRRGRPVRVGAAAKPKPKARAADDFDLDEYRPGEKK